MAGGVILDIAYGLDIQSPHDPYLERAEEALAIIDKAGNPGSFYVDIIPACQFLSTAPSDTLLIVPVNYSEARPGMDARRRVQAQGERMARVRGHVYRAAV